MKLNVVKIAIDEKRESFLIEFALKSKERKQSLESVDVSLITLIDFLFVLFGREIV